MKRLLYASAAVFAFASPALSNTYDMTSFSLDPGAQTVAVTSPVGRTVLAGEIALHSTTQGDLQVWCLDLTDTLLAPYIYQVNTFHAGDIRPGIPILTAVQVRAIASLMEFGLTVNPDANSDAAVQIAIWSEEYGASFGDTGVSAPLAAKVAILLADAQNGGLIDCPTCSLTVLTDAASAPNQALGFAVAVPGPILGTGLPGLITAMFGLWAFRRRRAQPAGV
jgi:hypothetical protein